ncbi:MAG: glycerol acyltransferase [Myxococcales bacterium]|nr:glycerol acyltransferase [Myxococcales bacterium]
MPYDIDNLEQRDPKRIELALHFIEKVLIPWHRGEVRGVERVPSGAALFVGNHNGGLMTPDTFIFCRAIYRAHGLDGVPYGLGHEVPLSMPILNQLVVPLGAVRACDENARRLFDLGRKVLVYPGGDEDAMRPFRHRNRIVFGGRRGYIRTALRHSVPIIPVVAAGAHSTFIVLDDLRWLARWLGVDRRLRIKVWPAVLSFPWGLTVGPPPFYVPFPSKIRIEILDPIHFDRVGPEAAADAAYVAACAARVEAAMQQTLDRLVA